MRLIGRGSVVLCFTVVASCHRQAATSAPAPAPGSGAAQTPPSTQTPPGSATAGAAATPAQRPRRAPPNPVLQDSIRRATVATLLAEIAGKENQPAATVFKNVKLLKDMPAGEFLKTMDEIYGRGLGMVCTGCHIQGKWDDDSRKNKIIARQMQQMTTQLNTVTLPTVKELDEDWHKVSCVMCHRGTGHAANTMPVPPAPTTTTPAQGSPPPLGSR
jgi:hypothetical protein